MKPNSILIVDDDKDLRDLMVDFLEEQGFSMLQAENAVAAFKTIHLEKPDLILLDIEMPGKNGLDICRILKAKPSTSDIPVIIVSGSMASGNMLSAYLAGAALFLRKPFILKELGESVKNMLRQRTATV